MLIFFGWSYLTFQSKSRCLIIYQITVFLLHESQNDWLLAWCIEIALRLYTKPGKLFFGFVSSFKKKKKRYVQTGWGVKCHPRLRSMVINKSYNFFFFSRSLKFMKKYLRYFSSCEFYGRYYVLSYYYYYNL